MKDTRQDGRSSHTLRPLSCELGCLQAADGSALWKAGNTHVLAAVHGPIAPRIAAEEHADKCLIQVVIQTGAFAEWEAFLTRILTACCYTRLYPRCVVSITLHFISQDGSVLAAALHAAVSALMDAGIEMQTLPVGVTCLLVPSMMTTMIQLDPTQVEEDEAASVVMVLTDTDKLVSCHSSCLNASMDTILRCSALASNVSQAVTAFWRIAIETKVKSQIMMS